METNLVTLTRKGQQPTIFDPRKKVPQPYELWFDGQFCQNIGDNPPTLWIRLNGKVEQIPTGTIDIAALIHAAPFKVTPVGMDEFGIWDSVTGFLRKLSWSNLQYTLKTFFDTKYAPIGSAGDVTKSKTVLFSDLNGGGSPSTDVYINIDPLAKGEMISAIWLNVTTNYLASDGSNDLNCDFYDLTNSLIFILNLKYYLDFYSGQGNMATYVNLIYLRDLTTSINLALHFTAADLTKLIAGSLTIYWVIKKL